MTSRNPIVTASTAAKAAGQTADARVRILEAENRRLRLQLNQELDAVRFNK